jgi:hypothetical protein
MASLMFRCTACQTERSIPLEVVPRRGLDFAEEINYPCTNCFRKGLMLDPGYPRRFVSTGVFLNDRGNQIEMVISEYFN